MSSNLPLNEPTDYIPSGVHGTLTFPYSEYGRPIDGNEIKSWVWNAVRRESRRSGYKLGTQLIVTSTFTDEATVVDFEVDE